MTFVSFAISQRFVLRGATLLIATTFLSFCTYHLAHAQQNGTVAKTTLPQTPPARVPVPLWAPVQDKNFYLLSLLERTPQVAQALAADGVLQKVTAAQQAKMTAGLTTSATDAPAAITSMLWSQTDIDAIATELQTSTGAIAP